MGEEGGRPRDGQRSSSMMELLAPTRPSRSPTPCRPPRKEWHGLPFSEASSAVFSESMLCRGSVHKDWAVFRPHLQAQLCVQTVQLLLNSIVLSTVWFQFQFCSHGLRPSHGEVPHPDRLGNWGKHCVRGSV